MVVYDVPGHRGKCHHEQDHHYRCFRTWVDSSGEATLYMLFQHVMYMLSELIPNIYMTPMQMTAELRVLSPRVPVRKINFIRPCQRLQHNIWAVVDVSIDGILELDAPPSTYTACRFLPSGCKIEQLDSGYCKVLHRYT